MGSRPSFSLFDRLKHGWGVCPMADAGESASVQGTSAEKSRLFFQALSGERATVVLGKGAVPKVDIRLCAPDRLEAIKALQQKIYDGLPNPETFVCTSEAELKESLACDICIGAFDGDRLAAFTLMVINRPTRRNLVYLFDDTEQSARRSVTYDTTFIDPEFIGCGLQRFFITLKDRMAVSLGADTAYATVSPDNTYSLNNLLSNGFKTAGKKKLYGGHMRYILRKPLGIGL